MPYAEGVRLLDFMCEVEFTTYHIRAVFEADVADSAIQLLDVSIE